MCPISEWEVEKRYREFHSLHQVLAGKKKAGVRLVLPKFPPKKLLKNKSSHVIQERREALANYMNELVQSFNIFSDPEVCSFISMKDSKNAQIMRAYFKNLYEYQESIMKMSGHKISDVSDKSGNSEEAPGSTLKSPVKLRQN